MDNHAMIEVALFQPEIPQNTGNIIRLCANAGSGLHLIHPLGFVWDDRRLRRAGLDYHQLAIVTQHQDQDGFFQDTANRRLWALTTRGGQRHDLAQFQDGDLLVFGPETRGLPDSVLQRIPRERQLRIPMAPGSRSLNLSNACAIVLYEALRQLEFPNLG
jgi:tRNA (cytidine/uridine-2'-O-)-methyltransferase